MKYTYTDKSKIHGTGIFSIEDIKKDEIIVPTHFLYESRWWPTKDGYYNHSENPNCKVITKNTVNLLVSIRDIKKYEELTADYTKQSYLEQPKEDWTI